ncbi:MAG: nicotinate phosphoribosyltransferase [Coriobacteriales bacterium]|jgi:nicotinate phosphoribosyltransferase|nr:nicotinate phosphoribosyltransferase [Coriobacteriales bacterium]
MDTNLTLLTDLYQLTMAQGYWQNDLADTQACFYMHFRENPFHGGYTISCGAQHLAEFIDGFGFAQDDIDYLKRVPAPDGTPLFNGEFLDSLATLELSVDIDVAPEGEVVFPYEPIVRVIGPIMQCQLIETALLNCINFPTLIATKAARVCQAAAGPVAEFGLRRAQGPNGGVTAARAAIVGGCASTSNVLAGKLYDLPVSGTHAHSWVMAFPSELAAFRAYAHAFPHNCVLLVDTFDVEQGVRNAITVAHEMEADGQRLAGIRIDSGDLAWLSTKARKMLDDDDLYYVKIVASNDLDEYTVQSLRKEQNAPIDSWGVGTRLATAYDQPALGGVYKLSAKRACQPSVSASATNNAVPATNNAMPAPNNVTPTPNSVMQSSNNVMSAHSNVIPGLTRNPHEDARETTTWQPCMKATEQVRKSTLPGVLATRRYFDASGTMIGDMVYDATHGPTADRITDPLDELRKKDLSAAAASHDILQPLVRAGKVAVKLLSAMQAQKNAESNLASLDPSNKRLLNPHSYPVGLDDYVLSTRDELLKAARGL